MPRPMGWHKADVFLFGLTRMNGCEVRRLFLQEVWLSADSNEPEDGEGVTRGRGGSARTRRFVSLPSTHPEENLHDEYPMRLAFIVSGAHGCHDTARRVPVFDRSNPPCQRTVRHTNRSLQLPFGHTS